MYCTVQSVRDRLTPGGNGIGTATTLEDSQIIEAIETGDAVIDSYVSRFYTIPTEPDEDDPTQTVAVKPIRQFSVIFALYYATLDYRRNQDLTDQDPTIRRYNSILAILQAVGAGKGTLPLPPVDPGSGGDTGAGDATVVNQYIGTLFGPRDFGLGYGQGRPWGPRGW